MYETNYLKRVLLCCYCLFLSSLICGQQPDLVFQHISDGLPQHTISSFGQDEHGFMWIGTYYGLARYDGTHFHTFEYDYEDSLSLRNNVINSLTTDQEGKIWIGTYGGGLNIYDVHQDEFKRLKLTDTSRLATPNDDFITAIYQDQQSFMWVGTEKGGLFIYDPGQKTYSHYFTGRDKPEKVSFTYTSAICEDAYGNIWVGTFGEGLSRIDRQSGHITSFTPDYSTAELRTPGKVIRCLHRGKDGRFWVGTDEGFFEIVQDEKGRVTFLRSTPDTKIGRELQQSIVLSICQQGDVLWIGTENMGLYQLTLSTSELEHFVNDPIDANSISGNSIWSLFLDRDESLWIGTYMKGVNKLDPLQQRFRNVQQLFSEKNELFDLGVVTSVSEDGKGNLWIGTDGDGLFYYDQKKETYQHFSTQTTPSLSSDYVVDIYIDTNNNLWVGTWNGGINLLRPGAVSFEQITRDSRANNSVSSNDIHDITEDKYGRIWIASFRSGIDVYLPQEDRFIHFAKENKKRPLSSDKNRVLMADEAGHIWIGSQESGIQKLSIDEELNITDSKTFFTGEAAYESEAVVINGFFLDREGMLWVGTGGNGLLRINPETNDYQRFSKKDGLPSNMICAIEQDQQGRIWASSNQGIFSLRPETGKVNTYNTEDGLQDEEFFKSCSLNSSNGRLFFGGINGFTFFDPVQVLEEQQHLKTYITKLLVSNQPWPHDAESTNSRSIFNNQKIRLTYQQNDLDFHFTAINYLPGSNRKYRYRLHPYDERWRENKSDLSASYANVPPGAYTFEVVAANKDGSWSDQTASLNLFIRKPWYGTDLAYFSYAMIVLGILLWSRNNIISRERLRGELELEKVERHKMEEIDQLKSQFFANISHEFKTPLTLMMSPLRNLLKNSSVNESHKGLYQLMMRNAERLSQLINQILDLNMIETGHMKLSVAEQDFSAFVRQLAVNFCSYADTRFIHYELHIPPTPVFLFFEKDKMEKVLVNLLSNAFKFTPEYGTIMLELREEKDAVLLSVKDTGVGIKREEQALIFDRFYKAKQVAGTAGTGIGLALSKQLVEMHGGRIRVNSEPQKGTIFTVIMQKGHAHFRSEEIETDDTTATRKLNKDVLMPLNKTGTLKQEVGSALASGIEKAFVILIVEDNPDMRSFLCTFLGEKYKLITAENGAEGYKKAEKYMPDLIISDVMMPEMNGFEFSRKIKGNPLTSHIFILLLTVKSSEESLQEGLSTGVDSYMTKPFNPELLELRIQNLLASRRRFKEQIVSRHTVDLSPAEVPYSPLDEAFLKDLIATVEKNISNPDFKIDDLCREMGYSRSQLYRKLKSLVDMSANEFIRMIRLKRAAQLLEHEGVRVGEVAYQVGFNNLQYFREAFRKQYSMSPSAYRESLSE